MPFKPHPDNPDLVIYKPNEYLIPYWIPKREWQDLDEVEIIGCTCECIDDGTFDMKCAIDFARAIEAQLRRNNE
jgi:hypothetical protein